MDDQFTMLVDASKCINCKGCEAACKLENMVYEDINESHETPTFWQRCSVEQVGPEQTKNNGIFNFFMPCMHCEKPACVAVCPVPGKAIHKDEETGIVLPDSEKCNGCGLCVMACPYGAVRMSDRHNSKGQQVIDKCTYCHHLVADNVNKPKEDWVMPACVTKCPSGALDFGLKKDFTHNHKLMYLIDLPGYDTATCYNQVQGFDKEQTPELLKSRRRTTSSDLTDLVFSSIRGVLAHGRKDQYGPFLYENDDYDKDAWDIDDFDWENYHKRISNFKIEKGDYKWI